MDEDDIVDACPIESVGLCVYFEHLVWHYTYVYVVHYNCLLRYMYVSGALSAALYVCVSGALVVYLVHFNNKCRV